MADGDGARAQPIDQNLAEKGLRLERAEALVEGQDQDLLDAVLLHQGAAFGGRAQQQRRALGGQDLGRVGIEGQRRGAHAALARQAHDVTHQFVMGGVDAVEIADGQRARREGGACLVEAAIDAHAVPLQIDGHLKAVVTQAHAGRQQALGALVRQVVRDVSEPRLARLQPFDQPQALLDGAVRGMRFITQRVQEQHIQAAEQGQGFFRDVAVVSQVGRFAETETVAGPASVKHGHGLEAQSGDLDRRAVEGVGPDARPRGLGLASMKDVGENAPDDSQRFLGGIDRDRLGLQKVERAQIVEAQDVVGVAVSKQHRVDAREARAQGLLAEIGPRVDDHAMAVPAQRDRGPQSPVARVVRVAHRARAADRRDAHTRARAQHRDGQPLGRLRHRPAGHLPWAPLPRSRRAAAPARHRLALAACVHLQTPRCSGSAVR